MHNAYSIYGGTLSDISLAIKDKTKQFVNTPVPEMANKISNIISTKPLMPNNIALVDISFWATKGSSLKGIHFVPESQIESYHSYYARDYFNAVDSPKLCYGYSRGDSVYICSQDDAPIYTATYMKDNNAFEHLTYNSVNAYRRRYDKESTDEFFNRVNTYFTEGAAPHHQFFGISSYRPQSLDFGDLELALDKFPSLKYFRFQCYDDKLLIGDFNTEKLNKASLKCYDLGDFISERNYEYPNLVKKSSNKFFIPQSLIYCNNTFSHYSPYIEYEKKENAMNIENNTVTIPFGAKNIYKMLSGLIYPIEKVYLPYNAYDMGIAFQDTISLKYVDGPDSVILPPYYESAFGTGWWGEKYGYCSELESFLFNNFIISPHYNYLDDVGSFPKTHNLINYAPKLKQIPNFVGYNNNNYIRFDNIKTFCPSDLFGRCNGLEYMCNFKADLFLNYPTKSNTVTGCFECKKDSNSSAPKLKRLDTYQNIVLTNSIRMTINIPTEATNLEYGMSAKNIVSNDSLTIIGYMKNESTTELVCPNMNGLPLYQNSQDYISCFGWLDYCMYHICGGDYSKRKFSYINLQLSYNYLNLKIYNFPIHGNIWAIKTMGTTNIHEDFCLYNFQKIKQAMPLNIYVMNGSGTMNMLINGKAELIPYPSGSKITFIKSGNNYINTERKINIIPIEKSPIPTVKEMVCPYDFR